MMMTHRQDRFTKLLPVALLALLSSSRETFAFHHGGSHGRFSCIRGPPTNAKARLAFVHGVTNLVHDKNPRGRQRYRSSSSFYSPSALFQRPDQPDNNNNNSASSSSYSDDCFGLLSLVGGAATMDAVFVGIFVILSAIAATLTSTGSIPANRRVPGIVAALTLACTLAVSWNDSNLLSSLTDIMGYTYTTADINPNATLIEIALCSISITYSLLGDPKTVDGNKR